MPSSENEFGGATRLRLRAEEMLKQRPDVESQANADALKLIHELEVHQTELEIQNEELQRAQGEISTLHREYEDLYEFAPCGYVTLNPKGIITRCNLSGVTLLGVEKTRLKGVGFSSFVAPEKRDDCWAALKRAGKTGEKQSVELKLIRGDKEPLWVLADIQANRTVTGEVSHWRLVLVGITERKRAEDALLESEQRVRRLNGHILNMVMALSHDIRGPLVAIASILKLMLRGAYGKLDQRLADTVQDLLTYSARLLGTAEDYLGKASSVGGSIEMIREVLDLRQDIIDVILEELAGDITRHEIFIDNRLGAIPTGTIPICANKTWLKAVYRNLFTNAVKYGGKGCTIAFGFEQRESHYRLNVYNSGRPIAEEDREKIFDRFGRLEPLDGPIPDGVGLGLYLCREIILEHGGEIWYEALPDGSNFVFTISREAESRA